MIGQTLSHYRITAALGAGGMGEVYRAIDTTLGRDVAIKMLPPEVAQDPERLARFEREAHLLASLNHPNIAAIYGLEEVDGKPFLALELAEGEDLKKRLASGPIPVDEALDIAEQVAEALEAAHNKGIVHRDLKPANVKLSPEGTVKVLDFGLAKAWTNDMPDESPSPGRLSQSPTLPQTSTGAGVVLGTAAYMSPEQARGKPVDKRADIWSFGVLLWEMLTGRGLFARDTVTDVIAALTHEDPDLEALPKATPYTVRRLLSQCLRKDPRTRLPDIGAARLELQDLRAGTTVVTAPPSIVDESRRAERRNARERWLWVAALVVAPALAAYATFLHLTKVVPSRRSAHFVLDLPTGLSAPEWGAPSVSPDGGQVVFAGTGSNGETMLWSRALDEAIVRPLAGTEGAVLPFWSPDGRSVGFFAGEELRRLSLTTSTIQTICALPEQAPVGGTWSEDGRILFAAGGTSSRIYMATAAGGKAQPFTTHDAVRGENGHFWPQFLPDGRSFLFLVATTDGTGLYTAPIDRPGERRRIRSGTERTLFAPPGHLLFVHGGTLLAQAFDPARAELTGEPAVVTQPVAVWPTAPHLGQGWFSASPSGTLAYLEGLGTRPLELAWFDRKGARLETVGKPGAYGQIALSPDEKRVAVELSDGGAPDLWTIDLARGVATRRTFKRRSDNNPVWSPDGRELVFTSGTPGSSRLYRKVLEGNTPESPLGQEVVNVYSESWSASEKAILYVTHSAERHAIGMVGTEANAHLETIMEEGFALDEPQVSPDGRWLAYMSQESGQWEVYLEPFRMAGERVRVSTEGGGQPRWRGDGQEIFYVSPRGRLMAVDVQASSHRIDVGLPVSLFSGVIASADTVHYAPTADGRRFLVPVPLSKDAGMRVHVVTDWTSLLK